MKNQLNHCWGTAVHKAHVMKYLLSFSGRLMWRALTHDLSKFGSFERAVFSEVTPQFKDNPYGSDGYKDCLKALGPALEHHLASNRHHPEHFGDAGVDGMTLVDLVEMVCDWKAASKRHPGSTLLKSLEVNEKRFSLERQLLRILENTAEQLKW